MNYSKQITVSVCIVILFDILTTLFRHWIFHSIGFCLCGLLWVVHPVLLSGRTPNLREKTLIRAAGTVLILAGVFSRAYLY